METVEHLVCEMPGILLRNCLIFTLIWANSSAATGPTLAWTRDHMNVAQSLHDRRAVSKQIHHISLQAADVILMLCSKLVPAVPRWQKINFVLTTI